MKGGRFWARLVAYIIATVCFLFALDAHTPVWATGIAALYAVWRFIMWARGRFLCMHCLIRFLIGVLATVLLYFDLPFQYYLAAILFVWLDFFVRFGQEYRKH